jgi:CheY-specific phosphatase CheX
MNAAIKDILSGVVVDTLEKLAFLFAVPLEGPAPEDTEEVATVQVRFSGPLCGGMQLGLSRPVLAELAGNMLGADDGSALSVEVQHDALKELMNVICGNLLPVICGNNAEFSIQPPAVLAGGARAGFGEFGPIAAVSNLSVESGICRVALHLDGPVPTEGVSP